MDEGIYSGIFIFFLILHGVFKKKFPNYMVVIFSIHICFLSNVYVVNQTIFFQELNHQGGCVVRMFFWSNKCWATTQLAVGGSDKNGFSHTALLETAVILKKKLIHFC